MRIALCGASGTGKTALLKRISQEYRLPVNPIGARSVAAEMGFANPYDVDAAGRRAEFQKKLLEAKLDWEVLADRFVTDRTPFDVIAYAGLHCSQSVDGGMIWRAVEGMRRYTHVFFCPMAAVFRPGDDPARLKDRAYHELFEALLDGLLRAWGVHVLRLYMEGADRWVFVRKMLEDR